MKKSELRQIIKEEYKKFTEEDAEKDIKEAESYRFFFKRIKTGNISI